MTAYIVAHIVIGIPVYIILGRLAFFSSWEEFGGAFVYLVKPEILSALDSELTEDWWSGVKLIVNLLVTAALGYAIHQAAGSEIQGILTSMGF